MNRRLPILVFLLSVAFATMFLLTGAAQAQITSQKDVNLSKMTGDQSECAVAKNPTNKLQLFALCNNNAGAGLFAARSIDGGATWVYPDPSKTIANGVKPALGPAACCDPTLSWDTFGNLFITYIDSGITTIEVLLSQDGGQTFTNITPASFSSCAGCPDQPTIVADTTTAVGAPVAVWVVWHRNAPTGPIVASGAAVTGLGVVGAFSAPQDVPGTANCSYGDVAISPAGVVVQTCQTPSTGNLPGAQILVNTKPDGLGPGPFGAAVTATTTNVAAFHPIPAQNSRTIDAEAGLAYDRNNNPMSPATPLGPSPHFGRLYLVYTEEPVFGSGATNIMLRFSDDNGATWSNPPIFVNDDSAINTTSKFFPKIVSNRLSGNIAVCWYDARNSATNTAMQVFCTIATPTFPSPNFMPNGQISDGATTSSASPNQFGDYSGLAYFQGLAHPAWPDTSNSTGDNPDGTTTFDIYSDRVYGGAAAHEGDPHLTTVNGVHYDFQGAGEFVVLRDYDGLEIQTRQAPIATTFNPGADPHDGLATCVSLNTAVAAQVGQHRVSYEPNLSGVPDPSGLQLRVDGDLTTLGANGVNLGDGGRIAKTSAGGGIEVDFPDETVMFVTPGWWASQSKWYLNVDVSRTPALEGVLGVVRPGGWLPALPDGTSMGPMPSPLHQRYEDLYRKFADAWRVTDTTSLFDYAPGTSTGTFTLRSWPLEKPPCILPETKPVPPASQIVGERACSRITGKNMHADCVFDVMVSGNPGFAKTYQLSQQIQQDSTTTTVTDDENPSQVGEWVTFTAIVTPNALTNKGIPAGTVQFTVDGSKVGERVKLDAKGRATWETSRLKVGTHQVAASYIPGEDSVFLASSSLEELHTVKRCPCVSGGGDK